ncbi:metal-dependent hydrolase [Brachybacterium hainanense]|uniref:Metal-dependent hydrolase n=1 Tax=Brachybacterium hainanense TaxID=1541174 RepID=A0ABV6RDK5_9MICO
MMGGHHAVTGTAAWMAVVGSAEVAGRPLGLGLADLSPAEVLAGAVVATGAALLPDIDHPGATLARSGGLLSRLLSRSVGAAAGHRGATHTPLAVLVVTAIAAGVSAADASLRVPVLGQIQLGAALLVAGMTVLGVSALRVVDGHVLPWAIGLAAGAGIGVLAPETTLWLPLAVGIGCLSHLLGDLLTTRGIPFPLWPLVLRPGRAAGVLWHRSGNVALPVLGDAGSVREWALCAILGAYAALALLGAAWPVLRALPIS